MSDDPPANVLMTRAANGDKQAGEALVERYAPLIWSICRRYQLSSADAADIGQAIWPQVMDQLGKVRDLAALTGWLAATTQRECGKVRRAAYGPQAAGKALAAETIPDDQTGNAEQELLLAELHATLREALIGLPSCCQQLIALLTADPPLPDAQISAKLGIPAGSIGSRRIRCLDKLRRDPAIAALLDAHAAAARGKLSRQAAAQRSRSEDGRADGCLPRQKSGRSTAGSQAVPLSELAILYRSAAASTPGTHGTNSAIGKSVA
jgi:RNA polymerase sigma factor (sigma-70 family)